MSYRGILLMSIVASISLRCLELVMWLCIIMLLMVYIFLFLIHLLTKVWLIDILLWFGTSVWLYCGIRLIWDNTSSSRLLLLWGLKFVKSFPQIAQILKKMALWETILWLSGGLFSSDIKAYVFQKFNKLSILSKRPNTAIACIAGTATNTHTQVWSITALSGGILQGAASLGMNQALIIGFVVVLILRLAVRRRSHMMLSYRSITTHDRLIYLHRTTIS